MPSNVMMLKYMENFTAQISTQRYSDGSWGSLKGTSENGLESWRIVENMSRFMFVTLSSAEIGFLDGFRGPNLVCANTTFLSSKSILMDK